jgi:hypothetical protein
MMATVATPATATTANAMTVIASLFSGKEFPDIVLLP